MWTTEQVKDYATDQLGNGNRIDMRDLEKLLPEGWEIEDWEVITDVNDNPGWYGRHLRMELITMLPTTALARPVFRKFIRDHWVWPGQFDVDLISKMDHQMIRLRHFQGVTVSDAFLEYPT